MGATRIELSAEMVRKAVSGEDASALNYRIAKAKRLDLDILICHPEEFRKSSWEVQEYLLQIIETILGIPVTKCHVVAREKANQP